MEADGLEFVLQLAIPERSSQVRYESKTFASKLLSERKTSKINLFHWRQDGTALLNWPHPLSKLALSTFNNTSFV